MGGAWRVAVLGVAAIGVATALVVVARADGGRVLSSEPIGASQVSVFLAPSPARVGPGDVSVLVQESAGGPAVLDARVTLELAPEKGSGPPARLDAVRGAAVNQMLYGAEANLFAPGGWRLRVEVTRGSETGSLETTFEVLPPLSPVKQYWPWLGAVPIVVAVFLLHQWLRDRQRLRTRPN